METFALDKSFYDIASAEELKELFDSDLDPTIHDVLRISGSNDLTLEWNILDKEIPTVILQDKLMTDAALGTRPIKTEHSYSLASDGDSLPDSPMSSKRIDDMEDECFPAIPMNTACTRLSSEIMIKDEPFSETESAHSSCPSSPTPSNMNESCTEAYFTGTPAKTAQSILRHANIMLATNNIFAHKRALPQISLKLEPGFQFPPTPPSCSSSSSDDSEDNTPASSQPPSPCVRKTNSRVMVSNHHHHHHHTSSTRQPIHTPLISTQPKGSTGILLLTEEEKRTLIAEGYPVPTRLPLSKAEEKSLKKVRRKIKNKISAQESRRKKKEYMDQLERKVEELVTENSEYKRKIEKLEGSNSDLVNQLTKLQAIVAKTHPQLVRYSK